MEAMYLRGVRCGEVEEDFEWDLREKIGKGAFGSVYKAKRKRDGIWYAVKQMSKDIMRNEKCWRQIAHEIEILRRLHHKHCVRFIDAFYSQTDIFIVLEYVAGGELYNVMKKRGSLKEKEAADITKQLLLAVNYLHSEKGIVHRDLKPENILIDPETMQIKLIDFGFSKFVGKVGDAVGLNASLTPNTPGYPGFLLAPPSPGSIAAGLGPNSPVPEQPILNTPKGSVRYMAPEIMDSLLKRNIKPRVTTREDIKKIDMFAVGVVLYIMLGGRFPFKCNNMDRPKDQCRTLLPQICKGVGFTADSWSPVSEGAKDLCRNMLHPTTSQRFSAEKALSHAWIVQSEKAPETPLPISPQELDPSMYETIRKEDAKMDPKETMDNLEYNLKQNLNISQPQQPAPVVAVGVTGGVPVIPGGPLAGGHILTPHETALPEAGFVAQKDTTFSLPSVKPRAKRAASGANTPKNVDRSPTKT